MKLVALLLIALAIFAQQSKIPWTDSEKPIVERIHTLRSLPDSERPAAMKDLAKKAMAGIVPTHEEALNLSDEELVERLVSVRGIGAWTVEMFLIFRLGRPDVLPIHDLGVKKGWSVAYGKKHMPTPGELLKFGERWRPYRTVASWYMWRAFERAGYAFTKTQTKMAMLYGFAATSLTNRNIAAKPSRRTVPS